MQAMSETRREKQSLTTHQGSRAMAIGGLMNEFREETTCPVCLEFFEDPVTIDCGHSFCQACFTQCCGESDADASCPQCKGTVQPTSVRPDRRLANLVELIKKAEKGKGAEEKWGGVCGTHEEPLKLFCKDDQALICVVCDRSIEHRNHCVLPVEEAAQEYKIKIQTCLISLEKERIKVKEQKVAEEEESQKFLGELGAEKLKSVAAFQQMQNFLKEKEYFWLAKLNDLEKEIQKRREENVSRLSEEISRLGLLITDMEEKCQQPATEFLQDISITLSRYEKNQERQHIELYPGMEETVRTYVVKTPALEKALGKCEEFLEEAWNKVNVTLDQNTANPFLLLSEDRKNVSSVGTNQGLPDSPKRFDTLQCVLGCEKFISGRHWWEVQVEGGGALCAVGIARNSVRRKGSVALNPNEGFWLVQRTTNGAAVTFSALTAPQPTVLYNYAPSKIRVSLDYEEGRVEFRHADTNQLIFTFPSASFSGEAICPFFLMQQGVTLNLK